MDIIIKIIEVILKFLNLKVDKDQKKVIEEEKQKQISKEQEVADKKKENCRAVHEGDADAINKLLNKSISIILFAIGCISLSGCTTKDVIYVTSDREVKRIEYECVKGYFVPDPVMNELLNYKVDAEYYKEQYESIKSEKCGK
jgi:hypothetical protein